MLDIFFYKIEKAFKKNTMLAVESKQHIFIFFYTDETVYLELVKQPRPRYFLVIPN